MGLLFPKLYAGILCSPLLQYRAEFPTSSEKFALYYILIGSILYLKCAGIFMGGEVQKDAFCLKINGWEQLCRVR